MFKKTITELGACFTYNQITNDHDALVTGWTLEGGYKNKSQQLYDDYPRKGTRLPLVASIFVLRGMVDGLCNGFTEGQGFKVFLHLPNEVPDMSKQYYLVPDRQIVNIKIVPRMITTAPELREISVEKRQCFFSDERHLRFYESYTQNNCELECVANLTVEICGCQKFFMPSE
jgi:acid-sensing ion channel, other